jgi:hypothetical protein
MSGTDTKSPVQRGCAFVCGALATVSSALKSLVSDVDFHVEHVDKSINLVGLRVTVLWTEYHSWVLVAFGFAAAVLLFVVLPAWLSWSLVAAGVVGLLVSLIRFLGNPESYR